ncbi:MAG: hypothetical protein QOH95_506, partial [Gaiellaceae bacterium]|nr:hypothetical protein [Gaiellaceae bacterium]
MPIGAEIELSAGPLDRLRRLDLTAPLALFVVALPVLFLHASFQPTLERSLGSTQVQVRLSDLAVLAIGVAAAIAAHRDGVAPLRHGRVVWAAAGIFLLYVFAASFYPLATNAAYPWRTHLVTAVKYAEYGLIAVAVPLVLRRPRDVMLVVWTLVLVSAAATSVALPQFFGVDIFRAWPAGGRQPGFVGVDDLGMLSAAAYAVALAHVAVGTRARHGRLLAWIAGVAGGLGMILSGALAAVLGSLLAALVAALVAKRFSMLDARRAIAIGLMALVVLAGSAFMRSSALGAFARFTGIGHADHGRHVESYSHR